MKSQNMDECTCDEVEVVMVQLDTEADFERYFKSLETGDAPGSG